MRDPFHRLPVPSKRPAGELERAAEEDAAGAEPLLMWRPIFSTTPERDQRAAIFGRGVSEADRFHAQTTARGSRSVMPEAAVYFAKGLEYLSFEMFILLEPKYPVPARATN
jgi:hypothetical protein